MPGALEDLQGPSAGPVVLPENIFWSPAGRIFDLDTESGRLDVCEAVFQAVSSAEAMAELLNHEVVASEWDSLFLPGRVRRAWEAAFPQLRRTALPAAA